jgi:antitoxin YefM
MPDNTYSISEIRDAITHLPEEFEQEQEPEAVKVTRRGKPVLAILPWDLYEAIIETLDVMSDAELMAAFREGVKDLEEGRIILLDDALKELGWE